MYTIELILILLENEEKRK